MHIQLARHFQTVRCQQGLSRSELARRLGYSNVSKGCNRIRRFEERGEAHAVLLRKLADALGIDNATVNGLIESDRQQFERQWNEWADQPIRPHLVIRLIPAVYSTRELPGYVGTLVDAEQFASQTARERNRKVCLVWTRRVSVWFDERGNVQCRTESRPGQPNIPTTRLSGSKRRFILRHPATGETILRLIDWPTKPVTVQGKNVPLIQPEQ